MDSRKHTAVSIRARKRVGPKIAVLTAYDATMAQLLDEGGVDILLVGDSLATVIQGNTTTLSVTLEQMCYHSRAVFRGARRAQVVCDMPFLSFQVSPAKALQAAGRLVQQGLCEAVKLEGGEVVAEQIRRIVGAGIPVMAHVGLLPQSVHAMGGYRVQGRTAESASRILRDAKAVEEAGAYAVVLEGIPQSLAAEVTEAISIPTIGIGAGPHCDGQVLVSYDFLGLYREAQSRFVKRFAELGQAVVEAAQTYVAEVRLGEFPGPEHSYGPGGTADRGEGQ